MHNKFTLIASLVFLCVAAAHLARIVFGWPILVAGVAIPVCINFFGFLLASTLAYWGLSLYRKG